MKYTTLNIVASLSRGTSGYYEIAPVGLDGAHETHKKLDFYLCRAKGLIKRSDHTKKLHEFLNTEEGNSWFDEVSADFY